MKSSRKSSLGQCAALAIAATLTTLAAPATQSTTINGSENIVVSGNSGRVSINIDNSKTNTHNTFVYNTSSGVSEQEVLDMTKAMAQQTQDRSNAFFNGLSRRLDLLGKQLAKQIAQVGRTQEELKSAQAELADLEIGNGERLDAVRSQVAQLSAELVRAEADRHEAAAQQIPSIASATATEVITRLREAEAEEVKAARQQRLSLTNVLTLGFDWSGFGRSNHALAEVDYRRAIWPVASDWALEVGVRGLLGSQSLTRRYVDGAGVTLNETPAKREVAYGLQVEVGVRGNRGGRLGIPIAAGWRRWSAGGVGHWAAVAEAGLEYRDSFTAGFAVTGTLELESTESRLQYTGVGAASRSLPRDGEVLLGGRAYVGAAF